MVTRADTPPAQTAIDLPALRAIVDRTAAVLSPDDHEQLLGAVQQLVELHSCIIRSKPIADSDGSRSVILTKPIGHSGEADHPI